MTSSAAARSAAARLLEIREATLGRYLEPGDEVVLRVDRLGTLRTPIVERPELTPERPSGAHAGMGR